MKITFTSVLDRNPVEIGRERQKFPGYPPAIHHLRNETRYEIMEGNVLRKLQEEEEVWKEVIKWIPSYPNCVSNVNAYYFGSNYAIKTQICVRLDFKVV